MAWAACGNASPAVTVTRYCAARPVGQPGGVFAPGVQHFRGDQHPGQVPGLAGQAGEHSDLVRLAADSDLGEHRTTPVPWSRRASSCGVPPAARDPSARIPGGSADQADTGRA
jgi:hypothetical protein